MGKMSELSLLLDEYREANRRASELADEICAMLLGNEPPAHEEVEEKKPLTLEDVRTILGYKSAHGYREEMHSLVKKYGNGFLSSVNPAMYEALLQEAEVYKVDAT